MDLMETISAMMDQEHEQERKAINNDSPGMRRLKRRMSRAYKLASFFVVMMICSLMPLPASAAAVSAGSSSTIKQSTTSGLSTPTMMQRPQETGGPDEPSCYTPDCANGPSNWPATASAANMFDTSMKGLWSSIVGLKDMVVSFWVVTFLFVIVYLVVGAYDPVTRPKRLLVQARRVHRT